MSRSSLFILLATVILGTGILLFFDDNVTSSPVAIIPIAQVSSAETAVATTTIATSTSATATSTPKVARAKKPLSKAIIPTAVATTSQNEAVRIENPYPYPAETFDQVNTDARSALVNILCEPRGASSLRPISGSGVIIDPRGVILTNAHVAQYVLLSESPQVNLACYIRTGSPATAQWVAVVMYIPPVWVNTHAGEILNPRPTGTGEHDYALLYIESTVSGDRLPASFPYLPIDTRDAIGFPGDQVLVASYPAELLGGIAAQYDLYSDTSITTIKQLLTFGTGSVDLLSLGGIIEAQSGSSGGSVVNAWGKLIALIATTSDGATTADRDLRAVTLSYINSDIATQSGSSLSALLSGDPESEVQQFTTSQAASLLQEYVTPLSTQGQ